MSQQDQQNRGEKPADPIQQHVSSTTHRPRTTGSERPLPSSTSMPVDLNARSQPMSSGTGPRQHSQEQETTVNPLYQMSMSSSDDGGSQAQQNEQNDKACNPQDDDDDKNEQEQENNNDEGDLSERKLIKQISQEFLHREDFIKCPKVNCQEKIILCIDISDELEKVSFRSRAGDKFSPMKLLKRAISFFLQSKHNLGQHHQFALCLLQDIAYWARDFTSDPKEIISYIDELIENKPSETFEMDSLFQTIQERARLPKVEDPAVIPPPYIVRTILFYGRSQCVPSKGNTEHLKLLQASPHFFIDAYYIHEVPSPENKCEEVYDVLCSLDAKGLSYMFEVSKSVTKLYDSMAQLLPHPLQRPFQSDARYNFPITTGELAT